MAGMTSTAYPTPYRDEWGAERGINTKKERIVRAATPSQLAYFWRLRALTSGHSKPPRTHSGAQHEIARLKRRARDLGIPRYHYEPYPVRTYFDPSIINAKVPADANSKPREQALSTWEHER